MGISTKQNVLARTKRAPALRPPREKKPPLVPLTPAEIWAGERHLVYKKNDSYPSLIILNCPTCGSHLAVQKRSGAFHCLGETCPVHGPDLEALTTYWQKVRPE